MVDLKVLRSTEDVKCMKEIKSRREGENKVKSLFSRLSKFSKPL